MSTDLVPSNASLLPLEYYAPERVDTNLKMAELAFKSGLLPADLKSPQAVLYVMQRGARLGLDPLFAVEHTHVVKGRLMLSVHAAQAILAANGIKWKVHKSTRDVADVEVFREGWESSRVVFGFEDAKTAGLLVKDSFKNFPADVLYANAFRKAARRIAADILCGMSFADESELLDRVHDAHAAYLAVVPELEAQDAAKPKRGRPRKSLETVQTTATTTEEAPALPESPQEPEDDESEPSDEEAPPPASGPRGFDRTNRDDLALLTEVANELGIPSAWRASNAELVFQALAMTAATKDAVRVTLQGLRK